MNKVVEKFDEALDFLFGKMGKLSRKTLENHGNVPIERIEMKREPVHTAVNTLMNIITLGKFNKAKSNVGYDQLFHLMLVATLENGTKILIEKNEMINIVPYKGDTSKTATIPVNTYKPRTLNINQLLENTKSKVGDRRFYDYEAFSINCQMFQIDILQHNKLLTLPLKTFILQDVSELITQLPEYTRFVSKLSTKLASYVNRIIQSIRYKKGGRVRPIAGMRRPVGVRQATKRRTRDYTLHGGIVEVENPNGHEIQNRDTIPALLVMGEIVIPKQHADLVEKFLKSKNIYLPGMKKD